MVSSSRSTSTQDLRRNVLDVELMPATAATYEKERFLYGGGYQNEERVVDDAPAARRRLRPWHLAVSVPCFFILAGVYFSRGSIIEVASSDDDDRRARAAAAAAEQRASTDATPLSSLSFPGAASTVADDDDDGGPTPLSSLSFPDAADDDDDDGPTPLSSLSFPGAADEDDGDVATCGGDAWEFTPGGYREACGGAAGNRASFSNETLDAALASCCADSLCAGFSFDNVTGDGVFKRNLECGVAASAAHDGYAKASRVPSAREADCGPFEHVSGGYREACGGYDGNLGDFQGLSLAEAERACCDAATCAGISFDNATGNGVLKSNVACGVATSDVYDGYSLRRSVPTRTVARPARGFGGPAGRGGP